MNRMKYETYGCIREKRSKSLFLDPLLSDRTLSIIPTTHINFCEFLRFLRDLLKIMFNAQFSILNQTKAKTDTVISTI